MKILLVTDGKYPEYVNGVSIYIHYLAKEMVKNGVDVSIFHHIKSGFFKRPKIIPSIDHHIHYYGIDHSPIAFHESLVHPKTSCHEKRVEFLFAYLLEKINPDIVHFHEFERTPSFCIEICKARNTPILVTLHDYWLLCPRLQLYTLDGKLCEGPDGGKNCIMNCLASNYLTRQYRKAIMLLPDGHLLKGIKKLRNIYKRIKGEHLGQTAPLGLVKENDLGMKDRKLLEAFRMREIFNKNALSQGDLIFAVSSCVKNVFTTHGIDAGKIIVNPLGVKSMEWIEKKCRKFKQYPVRFGFLGHLGPSKGAQIIVEAAGRIPPDKAQFLFYGGADPDTLYDFKGHISNLMHCAYKGRYDYRELDDVFGSFDVLIIPSLWQETLGMIGLEAQAAGIPVIASRIGGMMDYIVQGKNGLLFPPGNVHKLTQCLNNIIRKPGLIQTMSSHSIIPKTIQEDCHSLLHFYKNVLKDHKQRIINYCSPISIRNPMQEAKPL